MKTKKIVSISIFSALIIILQIISTNINFGGFPITLTLIPIIISGAVYGTAFGTLMGLVFGACVSVMVVIGADPSGATMFAYRPVATVAICLVKGVLSAFLGSYIYRKIENKKIGILLSAITTPVVNTLTLFVGLVLFFDYGFASLVAGVTSINFVIEVLLNVAIAPALLPLIKKATKRYV